MQENIVTTEEMIEFQQDTNIETLGLAVSFANEPTAILTSTPVEVFVAEQYKILATSVSVTPGLEQPINDSFIPKPEVPVPKQITISTTLTPEPEVSVPAPELAENEQFPLKNIANIYDPDVEKFSESMQKLFYWPKSNLSKKKNKKRACNTSKVPSILSSSQWQSIQEIKEYQKRQKK